MTPLATLEPQVAEPFSNISEAALPARPKVGFISLGCPKNLVDSEVMMGLLHRGGAELTARAEDADILVVNTCSFIDSAKQESVDTILEMAQHKLANGGRARKLVVAGCLVERYRDEIRKNIPEVDAVIGTGEIEAVLEAAGIARTAAPAHPVSPFTVLSTSQVAAIESASLTPAQQDRDARLTVNLSGVIDEGQQIRRAASAVNQHSRPESSAPQVLREAARSRAPDAQSSRPEGDAREAAGRFSRDAWDGASAALPSYLYAHDTPRILTTARASAYIKIAEGCDHPCSFCIIPQLRGKFRSRPIASIVAEARQLIAQGVREITLIGQDTTCYGEDLPPSILTYPRSLSSRPEAESRSGETPLFRDANAGWASSAELPSTPRPLSSEPAALRRSELADLLDALAPLEGLHWLRFLYAYPNKVTTRLLEAIARHSNVAKYLDVPLQHASAGVLRRMKRGGTADRFLQIIAKARKTIPGLVLRTSFIVGFPGETDADFDELCAFVEAAQFDWLGVFSYSDEEGAGAFNLPAELKVPRRTIEARRRRLMRLQNKISRKARKQWIGREVEVLVEGESEETELLWQGRTLSMAPEIDGKVLINDFGPHDQLVPGTFYRAELTEAHDYDVVATIIE